MYQSYISVYHTISPLSNLNSHHSHHFHSSCQLSTQTFNTLSQNSTSKQSLLPPQLMSFSLVIFVDMPQMTPFFSHIHTTIHFTALYYTTHKLHSSMTLLYHPKVMDLGAQLGLCSYLLSRDFS